MEILDVECLVLDKEYLFVKVHTDEGLVGISECFRRHLQGTKAIIEEVLRPAIIRADPLNIENVWYKMADTLSLIGLHGFSATAMAGIDIALWDIKGKALGVPLYQLLGGKVRDKIPVYASSLLRNLSPVAEARRAVSFAEAGYTAYKLHSAVPYGIDEYPDNTVLTVKEIRKAVGDDLEILVDVNGAYTPHRAIEIGRQLEQLGVFHFEEPVPYFDLPGLAQVADALDIPIAAGEMQYNRWQFRDLLEQGHVDILMPDILKAGGLSEGQKIAGLAAAFNKPMSTHNTHPTLGTVANLHFIAAHRHAAYHHEYNIEPVSIRDDWPILKEPLQIKKGYITVPEGPGLGIELDEKMINKLAGR